MKPVYVRCPKCGVKNYFKSYWNWVLHTPFHWFGKRLTKCHLCGQRSYMKRVKPVEWKTIFNSDDWIVDYDRNNKVYRVSYFEDGHFVDECKFTAKH